MNVDEVLRWMETDPVARALVKHGNRQTVVKTLADRLAKVSKPPTKAPNVRSPRKREVRGEVPPMKAKTPSIEYIGRPIQRRLPTLEELWAQRRAQEEASRPLSTNAHEVFGFTPCWTCGGPVGPKAPRFGPWRRHRGCGSMTTNGARALAACDELGIPLNPSAAELLALRVAPYSETHREPTWSRGETRGAWRHVSRRALQKAAKEAQKALTRALASKPCTTGRCAWCGVERSQKWHVSPYLRADGSKAPLCSTCWSDFTTSGSPESGDALRAGLSFGATGVPHPLGESVPALRAHFEVGGGDGTPWSHLPSEALEGYRLEQWAKYGGRYAPEDRRAEALALATQKEQDKAVRTAEVQAEAERRNDTHGFLGEG